MDAGPLPASGRLLRRPGPAGIVAGFTGVEIDDPRLAEVLSPDAPLLCLHQGAIHAEGPVWEAARNRLVWSDVVNRRLLAWRPDGQVEAIVDPTPFINGNALDAQGRLVHCEHGRRCVSRSEGEGAPTPLVTHFEGRRFNSPNDVATAPDGAIWFTDPTFGLLVASQGSLEEPELDHRSLYRFDTRNRRLARMADFEQPNGLAFSPDGGTLYVTDTGRALNDIPGPETGATHHIEAFDVGESGAVSNRRLFRKTHHGCPDGLKVDRRGWVWTTAGDGVHVYAPDRTPLGFVPTPVVCANLAFGGPDGARLFIAAGPYLLALDLLG